MRAPAFIADRLISKMKSLSFKELDLIVKDVEAFRGFAVQEAIINNDVLVLSLRKGPREVSFIVDIGSQKPLFVATQEHLPVLKKQTKPIILFLRKHLLGKKFVGALRKEDFGRLVLLSFEGSGEESLEMELHLFPQARNIIARTGQAQLSLNKTKTLQEITSTMEDEDPREPAQIYSDWLSFRSKGKSRTPAPGEDFEKIRRKKEQGLESLKEKLMSLATEPWQAAGDWLASHRNVDFPSELPVELSPYVDLKKSLQANIDAIFEKSKHNKKKIEAVEKRIVDLEKELKSLTPESMNKQKQQRKSPESPLENAKGRTKNFENGMAAYIGKSAADNLKILRKAKAWYWWVHPKDIPGSHAIIAIAKGAPLDMAILKKVALWTLQETLSPKQWKDWQGIKSQFLYCECRFVTPIKGDKLGRVHYKNEKILTLIVEEPH
jgi:predicted ribosome quality control (RQC) complex YloA/Tae2 family protein